MVLFAIVASAAMGMFVTGMKASLVVRLDTGAKALTQERIEMMRNLTYRIPFAASPAANPPDFLDTYYTTSLMAAPNISAGAVSAGYVSAARVGPSARLPEEPQAGAFYRFVQPQVPGFSKYTQSVATQFISPTGDALAPDAGYNSQALSPADEAKSPYVRLAVTTKWTAGRLSKSYTVSSRLSDGQPAPAQLTIQGRITAVSVKTATAASYSASTASWTSPVNLAVSAAAISMDGSLTTGGQVTATADGALATLSPGGRLDGATAAVSVPPAGSTQAANAGAQSLTDAGGTVVASLAATSVQNVSASLTESMPFIASSTSPVRATVGGSGPGGHGLAVRNNAAGQVHLQLHSTKPQAYLADGADTAVATGFVSTVKGAAHKVTAGMTARSGTVALLPTTFAPDGLVQVELVSSSVTCESNGAAPTVTGAYSANVRYMTYTPAVINNGVAVPATYAYSPTMTVGTASAVKLTEAMLTSSVATGGKQVGVTPTGLPLWLGDYIRSWSSRDSVAAAGQPLKKSVQLDLAGLVSVETVATRHDAAITDATKRSDPTSTIGLQLGSISCVAEDMR